MLIKRSQHLWKCLCEDFHLLFSPHLRSCENEHSRPGLLDGPPFVWAIANIPVSRYNYPTACRNLGNPDMIGNSGWVQIMVGAGLGASGNEVREIRPSHVLIEEEDRS